MKWKEAFVYPLAISGRFSRGSGRGGGISGILTWRQPSIFPFAGSQLIGISTSRRSATWRPLGLCQITGWRRLATRKWNWSVGSGRAPAWRTHFVNRPVATGKQVDYEHVTVDYVNLRKTCSFWFCDRCWKRQPLRGRHRDPASRRRCSPPRGCWERRPPSRIHLQRLPCRHWNRENHRRSIRCPPTFLPLRSNRLLITSVAFPALCIRLVTYHNKFYSTAPKGLL